MTKRGRYLAPSRGKLSKRNTLSPAPLKEKLACANGFPDPGSSSTSFGQLNAVSDRSVYDPEHSDIKLVWAVVAVAWSHVPKW